MIKYIIPAESDQPQKDIPFNPSFSFFPGVKKPEPHAQYNLEQIVKGVRENQSWKIKTERLRKLKVHNEGRYKKEKEQAFAFTPSGIFSYRNNKSLDRHAYVMSLDFDGFKTTDDALAFRDKIAQFTETVFAFLSPSGLGVKVLIRLRTPTTEATHHSAWRALKDFIEKQRGFDVPPDGFAKDVSRLCFISHDPNAYYNPNPAAFDWEAYLNDNPQLRQDGVHHSDELEPSDFQYDGEDIPQWLLDALSYLDSDDYHVWLAVGSALKHGGFPFEIWDEWSQTSDKYKESDARYKWKKGFNRIPFDYIIKSAQREGWTPPWGKRIPKQMLNPELRTLAKQMGGGLSEWTWQYPGIVNGQPREQIRRHLYNPSLKQECPHCQKSVPTYIDFARLTSGPHCTECNGHQLKPEADTYSYLLYELERKPHDAIISDFEGFISIDPLLKEESLWNQDGLFHLGAPMGSGKTTLILHRAREAAETKALTLVVVPRESLAKAVYSELRKDTGLGWGLFHEGQKGEIGEYGAVCTLGWMPRLLKQIVKDYPDRPIRIFVDEIDFARALRLADIFKSLSKEIKEVLRERKDAIGIVTAGQTAYTLGLEAIAKELGCNLIGYYLSPRPAERIANLYIVDKDDTENRTNRIIQSLIDKAEGILAAGKKCYILGDERRSAQIIDAHFGDTALLYDKYHRQSPEVAELHRLQRLPDDKKVLIIATPAVDVGVSLKDENAETIVFNVTNPLHNGLSSTVQQCLRNRTKPPLSIYVMKYQNPLPLAPQQAIGFQTEHAQQKLVDGETLPHGLIDQLGIKDAMLSLEADQPETLIKHHLKQAGYQVQMQTIDWESIDFERVKETRKQIENAEYEKVKPKALAILCPARMLTVPEIRKLNWEQPDPTLRLAYELANALLRLAGWDGNVERFVDESNQIAADPDVAFKEAGVTKQMWEAAILAVKVGLDPDKVSGWSKGYLPTHYPSEAFDEFEASREFEIHHRPDDIFIGRVANALLEKLPRKPAPKEEVRQALIDTAQEPFGKDRLSALMKDGSVSPVVAKRMRFIDLGKDAVPDERHLKFVEWFIPRYYPARIAKVGDLYQLATPTNAEQVDAFKQLMQCRAKAAKPDIDPELENGDLTPPPAADPKSDDKVLVVSMRNNGLSFRDIETHTGTPIATAHRWCTETSSRSTDFLGKAYIENEWNAPSLPKSPQTRTTTAFEADSQKLAAPSEKLAAGEAASYIGLEAHCKLILELLTTGEKKRSEIVASLEVNIGSIDRALAHLVGAGEIVKVKGKRGVYCLPEHSTSDSITPTRSTGVFSERLTSVVPVVNYNDPQHYQFLPGPLPLSLAEIEFQRRVVDWAEGNRNFFESLSPSDITHLMQAFPDLFEFEPFRPTGNALDARVRDRGNLLREENYAILLDPSRQGDSAEAIERSIFYEGDFSLSAVRLAFLLALRNDIGKRWIESIQSAVDFEISRSRLFSCVQRADISLSRIHRYWGEAVDYRKGVVHPIVPFAKHWMHSD